MDAAPQHGLMRWFHRPLEDASERRLDEQLEDSFPASDPPSFSPVPARRDGFRKWRKALAFRSH